ncbi:MAG: efflux RND transporter periplasmic adaptor subunit [Bryobacteraceae bacterium]
MSKGSATFLAFVVAAGVLVAFAMSRRTAPPEIPFARATRQKVVSTVPTNGKVEPIQWASARSEREGVVEQVFVQRGQWVHAGDPLVQLDTSQATADLASANARITEATAELESLNHGGRTSDITEITNQLSKARLDLQIAQQEYDSAKRLLAKQAATRYDVESASQKVQSLQLQIQSLQRRRAALVSPGEKTIARGKLQDAEAAKALAERNLALGTIRAPIDGMAYAFDLRIGSFLHAGDLVADVGRLDHVKVVLYVDEPDLGRVGPGMAVNITWEALPGHEWHGSVSSASTHVVPLGTRQVGEVNCVIRNPGRDLLPGATIDAKIVSKVVPEALTVAQSTIRRQGEQTGVFLLSNGDTLVWRPVQIGVYTAARVQILKGLNEGDSVALPTDKSLRTGMRVEPVYPSAG